MAPVETRLGRLATLEQRSSPLPSMVVSGGTGCPVASLALLPHGQSFAWKRNIELVASFQECQHCSLWPSWRPRAVAECGAVSKIRGTPRQRVGRNVHNHRLFCSCTPEMYESHMRTFSPHISRGWADKKNSQPVHAQRVGPFLPSPHPYMSTTTEVTPRPTVGLTNGYRPARGTGGCTAEVGGCSPLARTNPGLAW